MISNKIILKFNDVISLKSSSSGYDGRFNLSSDIDYEKLRIISISFKKFHLLKRLEDPKISYYEKLEEINKNYVFDNEIKLNLTNGGLFKDWDMTF